MKSKPIIFIKFSKTGLGNLLLLWARANVAAKKYGAELILSHWWGFRWGAIVRREKHNRLYWKYFKETSNLKLLKVYFLKLLFGFQNEPENLKTIPELFEKSKVIEFKKVITNNHLFGELCEYEEALKIDLLKILHPIQKKILDTTKAPVIAVHIRRGDFKLGNAITELEFFIQGISMIRKSTNELLPVTVFSDATLEELSEIMRLPDVTLAEENSAIVDILRLSQSQFLILSASSTFSYWGAFFSRAFVIRSKADWQKSIKPNGKQQNYQEVVWDHRSEESTLELKKNLNAYLLNKEDN